MPGIEPGASHMQSVRSTTELHPLLVTTDFSSELVRKCYQSISMATIICLISPDVLRIGGIILGA